jgi:hypothetical protein
LSMDMMSTRPDLRGGSACFGGAGGWTVWAGWAGCWGSIGWLGESGPCSETRMRPRRGGGVARPGPVRSMVLLGDGPADMDSGLAECGMGPGRKVSGECMLGPDTAW